MTNATVSEIEGKSPYNGRSLVDWASEVAGLIAKVFDISRFVLFGSVARGDLGSGADIDLLVVMPMAGRRHDATMKILTVLGHIPMPVDVVVVDSTRFDEEAITPGIVRVAMRKGKTLWQSTHAREQSADG